jgi:branched-chain amino acid transport system permease protein
MGTEAFWHLLFNNLLNGIVFGGLLSLTAVGLTIIFGVLDIPNFAQGEFAMIGGFLCIFFMKSLSFSLIPASICAVILVFFIGVLCERLCISPFYGRGWQFFVLSFFVSLGLSFFFSDLVKNLRPTMCEVIPSPLTGVIDLGFFQIGTLRLITFVIPIVILFSLYVFSKRSLLGMAINAVAQDTVGATLVGINRSRIYTLTFGLGAALSGLSGILYGLIFGIYPTMGMDLNFYGFTIVAVGGMGNFLGAILASFLIGVVDSLTPMFIESNYKLMVIFVTLILILIFKPSGLLKGKS